MSEKEKSIDEFVKFTCASVTEATRYLENASWNTGTALAMYFDDRDDRVDPSTLGVETPANDLGDRDSENDSMHADEDYVDVETPQPFDFNSSSEEKSKKSDQSKPYTRSTNIATLSTIRNNQDEDDDDDDQLYYAGGSEHSGQQIMGNDKGQDVAGDVFRTLRQMVNSSAIEVAGPSRESSGTTLFSGVGYRLGQTPDDTQVVGKGGKSKDEKSPELRLRLWRNGFTVGDEPLRPYSDPENRGYIDMLLRGEVPMNIMPQGFKGSKVTVRVEDNRHELHSERKGNFAGQGHVLGNLAPQVVDKPVTNSSAPTLPVQPEEPPIASPVVIKEDEPTTNIAVRLPSGTRSQVRLNLTHTVEDLRLHLVTINRELSNQEFVFMVSFPPKELTDEKLTIAEAGLVNSSLHLRIKRN